MKLKMSLAILALIFGGSAVAQVKPEDAIKYRQSGYAFMAWNMQRIKLNLESGRFNKEEAIKAANAIQGIANSGMGALYLPGTDKGRGWEETHAKSSIWSEKEKVAKVAGDFVREADELARVVALGEPVAVANQLGKLGGTCKACHDDFRAKH